MSVNLPVFDLSDVADITLADLESVETEPTIGDLFAMAALIGDRYQSPEEISAHQAALAEVLADWPE